MPYSPERVEGSFPELRAWGSQTSAPTIPYNTNPAAAEAASTEPRHRTGRSRRLRDGSMCARVDGGPHGGRQRRTALRAKGNTCSGGLGLRSATRDHRQSRRHELGYAAASLHAGKHNHPHFAEPPQSEVRRSRPRRTPPGGREPETIVAPRRLVLYWRAP